MRDILMRSFLAAFLLLTATFYAASAVPPTIDQLIIKTSMSIVHVVWTQDETSTMTCSGFQINTGIIATANHCLGKVGDVVMVEESLGRVVAMDESDGVAVVVASISRGNLRLAKETAQAGDKVLFLGYTEPAYNVVGVTGSVLHTFTPITNLGLPPGDIVGAQGLNGMSGGPVVNMKGEVVGMHQAGTSKMSYSTRLEDLRRSLQKFLP